MRRAKNSNAREVRERRNIGWTLFNAGNNSHAYPFLALALNSTEERPWI